ncbi:MAG: copper resistance CopC family protein [Gammaproteobacteria bacterium]
MNKKFLMRLMSAILLILTSGIIIVPAYAHAFPERSSPHVGAHLKAGPNTVKIWFDAGIEPIFSKLIVRSAQGQKVSVGPGFIPKGQHALLETRLKTLTPGIYFVYWSVIAFDGHHTEGRWYFRVK